MQTTKLIDFCRVLSEVSSNSLGYMVLMTHFFCLVTVLMKSRSSNGRQRNAKNDLFRCVPKSVLILLGHFGAILVMHLRSSNYYESSAGQLPAECDTRSCLTNPFQVNKMSKSQNNFRCSPAFNGYISPHYFIISMEPLPLCNKTRATRSTQ